MGRIKEITIFTLTETGFIVPVKINAQKVLIDIFTCDFNFWIHSKEVSINTEWTITEETSGFSICTSTIDRRVCIEKARKKLKGITLDEFKQIVKKSIDTRRGSEHQLDPLWEALSKQGYNMTVGEMHDIISSLKDKGYKIQPII